MKKNIKNNAMVASKDQSKREKMKMIELAMMNGIKINKELQSLYQKGLILESDFIYYVDGELMIPGFHQDNPVPSYNGNGIETEITRYNELMTYFIRRNEEDLQTYSFTYKGVFIDCYYIDDDYDFELKYVLLKDTDITELVDVEDVFIELQKEIV